VLGKIFLEKKLEKFFEEGGLPVKGDSL